MAFWIFFVAFMAVTCWPCLSSFSGFLLWNTIDQQPAYKTKTAMYFAFDFGLLLFFSFDLLTITPELLASTLLLLAT